MNDEATGKRVFISYAREDSNFARKVASRLESLGHAVWFDTQQLKGGDEYFDVIASEIRSANAVIPIISHHSVRSKWVAREVIYAVDCDVPIIPVFMEFAEVPDKLNIIIAALHHIDFTEDRLDGDPWVALASAVSGRPAVEFEPADGVPADLHDIILKWNASRQPYKTMERHCKVLVPWAVEMEDADRIEDPEAMTLLLVASLHVGENWRFWTERNAPSARAVRELLELLGGDLIYMRPRFRALYALQHLDADLLKQEMAALEQPLPKDVVTLMERYVLTGRMEDYLEAASSADDPGVASKAAAVLREVRQLWGDHDDAGRDSGLPLL